MTASASTGLTPADTRAVASIRAALASNARYDDESIVHERWIRQRYECGCYASYAPARQAVVRTAWHEAGHAVAAIAIGARFSSASIHHGHRSEGRVHGVRGGLAQSFVVDAAGQLGEQLMDWTVPSGDAELRAWLASWRSDGGDAQRFRRAIRASYGGDEAAAWRYSEALLTPQRLRIRALARAMLVHPRHLTYAVASEIGSM